MTKVCYIMCLLKRYSTVSNKRHAFVFKSKHSQSAGVSIKDSSLRKRENRFLNFLVRDTEVSQHDMQIGRAGVNLQRQHTSVELQVVRHHRSSTKWLCSVRGFMEKKIDRNGVGE